VIGQTVSHYRIVSKLGSGGMGVVYEAEDTQLGRRVALKFLPPELAQDAAALERFQREARAASSLNHPGICTVYGVDQHEGHDFIAMELLEGETLAEHVRRGALALEKVLDMAIQMADALESAHAKGILHRDLKPANVLVSPRGHVKILDFGLAKMEARLGEPAVRPSEVQTAVRSGGLTQAGSTLGTVHYMSPEQARGQVTDARTDLFSLGAVIYQMATGQLPFGGDTSAVVFDAILNRDPRPLREWNGALPGDLGRIVGKALEKDRALRYQSATDLKTDLLRLRRDLDSGRRTAVTTEPAERSVAVLYLENLSGAREEEYLRDGVTEDIITELTKIRGLKIFSRPTVFPYRDKPVTPAQIGQQLGASYVLAGSIRRAGTRLRINAQLVDTRTDFPVWSERYDREMADVFELQDEIAHKIAEALRVTLSPQEKEALAARPTDNLQAYDLYLRGRSYARRRTRQDLDVALQMFGSAVTVDPQFALAHAAVAGACAQYHYDHQRTGDWLDRAKAASRRAVELNRELPDVQVAEAWILYAQGQYDEAAMRLRAVLARFPDAETGYYLLCRVLYGSGRFQEVADVAEVAVQAAGDDYNVYVPIMNALGALGKAEQRRSFRDRRIMTLERHLHDVPEDARARVLLASSFAETARAEDAVREMQFAIGLRPNDSSTLYNCACTYAKLGRKAEALAVLARSFEAGFKDVQWTRRDPDLASLHGEPEFESLYPDPAAPLPG
jgi:serine/threonine protein kinase/tetratricopeptide (TPR) repeat protein